MSGFLVLVAAELEARGLARNLGLRRLAASPWSRFGADGLEVQVVGLRAAGLAARGLGAGDPPDLLISAGSCGALSPALARTGALVLPELVLPPAGPPLALAHRTGAIAVDMESAIILAVARERGLAAIVVRGVSDTADQSLPPGLARLVDAGGQTRPARAAALVLRRPALLGQAWALRRGILLALTAVAVVIRELGETG